MFYCDECATKNKWPRGLSRSYGPCEVCEEVRDCNDVPSAQLPEPPREKLKPSTLGETKLVELCVALKEELHDRAREIDPGDKEDWYSLILGWALAKGLSVDHAHEFACYVKFQTELG